MTRAKKMVELVPNKYYFAVFDTPVNVQLKDSVLLTTDYAQFPQVNNYFGPPNISDVWKFCIMINESLVKADKKLVQWSVYNSKNQFTNSVFLVGAYLLLYCNRRPSQVMEFVKKVDVDNSITDYLDVTLLSFKLNMKYIYEGINLAVHYKWFNVNTFNYKLYEKEMATQNGHINWIVPGKLLALSEPTTFKKDLTYFVKYFQQNNVKAIIRLNEKTYDKTIFEKAGIIHFDYYFPDVTAPSLEIVQRFLQITHCINGAIAVHCRAGIGRTGTLIACYMMKFYSMSALQAIGWLRVCRPGSVMGPQQKFLMSMQNRICKMQINKCCNFLNLFGINNV